jgi:hypothetical protein
VSARDRTLLGAVLGVVALGAFWLLALNPKLSDLDAAKKDVAEARSGYQLARQEAQQFAQARLEFPRAYATMARLGKSVPTNVDQASLVYQLSQAADRAGVNFDNLELKVDSSAQPTATAAPAAAAGAAQAQSQPSGGESGGSGAPAAGAAPAAALPAAPTQPTETLETQTVGSSAADALTTASVPTGSTTGSANLRVMHFDFTFTGNFFRLEDFLRNIKRLTWSREDNLLISGRLFTVDAVTFDSDGNKVKLSATTYLMPLSQGVFAGATAAGPAGLAPGAPQAVSAPGGTTTPPTATVTAP